MATRRLTFGIDPSLSGAAATLIDGVPGPILDMPTREVDGWKEVDARALATFIRAQREAHPGAELQAALEKVMHGPAMAAPAHSASATATARLARCCR